MEPQASPEFSDYVHAIARRKALLIGIAIPIAVLAVLLSLTLPDIYTSSALVEIDEPSHAQTSASLDDNTPRTAVMPTSTCRTSRASCSRTATCASSTRSIDLYPDLEEDEVRHAQAAAPRHRRVRSSPRPFSIRAPAASAKSSTHSRSRTTTACRRRRRRVRSGWWPPSWPSIAASARAGRRTPPSSTPRKPSASARTWRSSSPSSRSSSAPTTASCPS